MSDSDGLQFKTVPNNYTRREFLQWGSVATASLGLPLEISARQKKSVLVFTKSSGFEHDVVKIQDGEPSIVETVVRELGAKYGFDVTATKDGRVFDSGEFRKYTALLFYTTGDLTTAGVDKNPPMSTGGKQAMLDAIHNGMGFVGVHAASDTFHVLPDDPSSRYTAHGDKADPYIRMVGAEFITHGNSPRLQTTNIIVNDSKFPGLDGVISPISFNEEWYSLKDFRTDMHVILTLDTKGLTGEPYRRAPYPMTWARMEGKGRVFFTAIGDRPENWSNPFFINLLGGGIRWAIRDAKATLTQNLRQVAPGYAEIPPAANAK